MHNDALPEGWQEHTDELGFVYYYNIITHESQWEKPQAPKQVREPTSNCCGVRDAAVRVVGYGPTDSYEISDVSCNQQCQHAQQ